MDYNRPKTSRVDSVFSKTVRAGKIRTYFFDVRKTRSEDYYLTITESKRRFNNQGYERHNLHLYKEDFNKFIEGLEEVIDYVKTELLPEYDYDQFSHRFDDEEGAERKTNFVAEEATTEEESTEEETVETVAEAEEPAVEEAEEQETTEAEEEDDDDDSDLMM